MPTAMLPARPMKRGFFARVCWRRWPGRRSRAPTRSMAPAMAAPNRDGPSKIRITRRFTISTGRFLMGSTPAVPERVTCAIRVSAAGVLYAWVRGGSAGTYSYSVDGGAPVAAAIAGPPNGYFMVADLIRIRGLSPGRHTFTLIAGSASLGFAGVGTVPPQTDLGCCRIVQGGVPYQKYDAATPTAAMSVAGTNLLTFAAAPRIIAPPAETERTMIEDLTDPRAIAAGTFATNATATT